MNRLQWLQGALPTRRLWHAMAAAVALLTAAAAAASADVDEKTLHLTPARVGYVEGDVSFWRPGAGDWEAATVNIPLAPGDALATRDGRFEVQVGPQAFLRAADQTQLRVKSQEPDFLQLEVTQGSAVLDLRHLPAGHVVEIDTPQGAMTANSDGFYRVDVDADSTRLTVRRAGTAALTPPGGQPIQVATGESVTVSGGAVGQLNLVAAPAFDDWDRWNYARADDVLAAPRSYAVSTDIYGAADLDRYGSWRYAPTYGRVWVPSSVPVGWAPYTSGRWLWDPIYGYSWVDYAPWGWAPFHYGRWVYSGYWAWAPGPVVFGAVYAPALVSFFTPALSVSIGVGFPFVGWTALSWGEPLVPWWGGVGFVGVPCWHGWGGPHIVNNIVINNGDTVNANQINVYRNAKVPGGLVGVPKDHFGGTDVQRVRLAALTSNDVKPLHGAMPASFGTTPGGAHAVPKGSLPALSPGRAATQSGGAGGATGFTRQAPATTGGPGTSAAPPKSGAQTAPFDRLRSGTGSAAAGGSGGATEFSRQAPATTGGLGTSAAPPKSGAQTAPFDRLRSGTGSAAAGRSGGATEFSRQAPPTTGGLGASAAPPKPGTQRAPFDRLRSSTVEAAREPLPKQALPSVGARTTTGNVAAPPPLRGMSKPQGGSVDAYRHLRSGAPSASGTAVAPTYPRGIQHAPVAKSAPPSLRPHSAAPAGGGNWNRAAQPAVPAPPRARSLARAESAPMAHFAPQPKPLSMPSMNSAPSGGGSLGGGGLGGGGGMGGGGGPGPAVPSGGGMSGGGGAGGGGRPNFSR